MRTNRMWLWVWRLAVFEPIVEFAARDYTTAAADEWFAFEVVVAVVDDEDGLL